jgi:RNA polymerase sigma factor (sigma-70 family)
MGSAMLPDSWLERQELQNYFSAICDRTTLFGELRFQGTAMAALEDELKALMIGALDGDAVAYKSLLRLLVLQLRSFFRRRIRSAEVAEDLVQDTLMAMHARRPTFDRDRLFSPWVFAIARYKIVDHFRRNRHSHLYSELEAHQSATDIEPAHAAAIDLERLLNTLPENGKERYARQRSRDCPWARPLQPRYQRVGCQSISSSWLEAPGGACSRKLS